MITSQIEEADGQFRAVVEEHEGSWHPTLEQAEADRLDAVAALELRDAIRASALARPDQNALNRILDEVLLRCADLLDAGTDPAELDDLIPGVVEKLIHERNAEIIHEDPTASAEIVDLCERFEQSGGRHEQI